MVAALQVLFGLALVRRPRPWLLLAGIAGHLALISLYVVTRTVGLPPVGPLAAPTALAPLPRSPAPGSYPPARGRRSGPPTDRRRDTRPVPLQSAGRVGSPRSRRAAGGRGWRAGRAAAARGRRRRSAARSAARLRPPAAGRRGGRPR